MGENVHHYFTILHTYWPISTTCCLQKSSLHYMPTVTARVCMPQVL